MPLFGSAKGEGLTGCPLLESVSTYSHPSARNWYFRVPEPQVQRGRQAIYDLSIQPIPTETTDLKAMGHPSKLLALRLLLRVPGSPW